jgi:photosystem II stability/assembly factor-like uncharacterized protein
MMMNLTGRIKNTNRSIMNKITLFFLFVLCIPTGTIYAQWEVKHVSETNTTLNVIKCYNEDIGFAMGNDGLVLKSTDQGESWMDIDALVEGNIMDFDFISADVMVLVSTGIFGNAEFERFIYFSEDGGSSWHASFIESGSFNSIHFFNDTIGLVSGAQNILRTVDRGSYWHEVYNITQHGFDYGEISRMNFINDSIGYAIGTGRVTGENGQILSFLLKTTDAGQSWQPIAEIANWLKTVAFIDENTGYLADALYSYKTTDGGMSWDTLNHLYGVVDFSWPSVDIGYTVNRPDAYIPEATTAFAIGKTTDAGASWTGSYNDGAHLESVFFLNDTTGFVAGDYSIIMKTTSGGGEITGDYPWHIFTSTTEKPLAYGDLEIYPNPSIDEIYIKGIDLNGQSAQIEVYTITGRQISTNQIPTLSPFSIDISNLPAGMYLVVLKQEKLHRFGFFTK